MNNDISSVLNSMQTGGLIMAILVGIVLISIQIGLKNKDKEKKD